MNKKYFAVKLIAPRPDFAQTMTEDEKNIMQQHGGYWKSFMDKGMVQLFGPVFDPAGVYGFGVVSFDDEEQLKEFLKNDPSAGINKIEYYPMMAVVAEK